LFFPKSYYYFFNASLAEGPRFPDFTSGSTPNKASMKIEGLLFTQICILFYFYILFSENRNDFYVGSTYDDLNERPHK
jgi:hypothetical protein